ncbi:hypothetical protein IFM89_030932 [Coptis chinensis]|uniref:Alpha/beta hydrolase fold-3 domain-containing protein n=1 Tax=Coptis chinensis TaxID=261450 RepID=A0A835HNA3_9MAGN|nr:hypothetical protein IFM89_030932 [Coptis chinensis]
MDTNKAELDYEFSPLLRAYKNGHIERLVDTDTVPPSFDPQINVTSKDVLIIPDSKVSARVYLPKLANTNKKLPLLVYFHGGGFCISSPFDSTYHRFLNSLVSRANVVAVSVDYRLAPEHPVPIAYEDSWAALKWIASHSEGHGPETWLKEFVDFSKVFLAGDSAGANIAHNMAMLAGDPNGGLSVIILGVALVHPYFWGSEPIGSEATGDPEWKDFLNRLWPFVCPSVPNHDNPQINPVGAGAPSLSRLGCKKVRVCVAQKDILRDRGWLYYETLRKCGWNNGDVEITETEGEGHDFHLYNPTCEKANNLIECLAAFLNLESPAL